MRSTSQSTQRYSNQHRDIAINTDITSISKITQVLTT